MLFLLKKFVAFWLMPVPCCLTLLVAGFVLGRSERRRRAGRLLAGAGVLLLVLFSNKVVSVALVRPLEQLYPAIPELVDGAPLPPALARCRFVVVLGGGHSDMPGLAATDKLSAPALARIVEAVRLLRRLPAARLIVSGPAIGKNPSHAAVLARAAESLGIDPSRILEIDTARDTEEESMAAKALVASAPAALVTSAWHMPRAAALFRAAGVDFLPCPADFTGRTNGDFRLTDLTWDSESLDRSTWAVHERLGLLWLRLRGRIPWSLKPARRPRPSTGG